jgi:iron complex transport system substrate-binding protein
MHTGVVSPAILSVSPESLLELADSFVAVAQVCGVAERGLFLRHQFLSGLRSIHDAVNITATGREGAAPPPTVFVLEWMNPPFDAGHWVPEVIQVRTSPRLPILMFLAD